MTTAPDGGRWSTSVARMVVPSIIAIVAALFTGLVINGAIRDDRLGRERADEAELGLSHGRIAGALYIRYTTNLVADYDPELSSQAATVQQLTTEILNFESVRLRSIEHRSSDHRDTAEELLDALDDARSGDVDLDEQFSALLDFDSVAPTLTTERGRAALQLSTGTYLTPSYLTLERAVADALLNDRLDDFALSQDDVVLALQDGHGGHLPSDVRVTFAGPDQNASIFYPNALRAVDVETRRSISLKQTANWLASFSSFFDDESAAISDPPSDLADDIDATTALFVRIDSALTFHVERAITNDRTDIADTGTLRWGLGIGGAVLFVAMAALAFSGLRRRRQELTLLRSAASRDALTGLPNRRAFVDRAERQLERDDAPGHVLFHIDVDDFKSVNDTSGHAAGDDVLRELSERIQLVIEAWTASKVARNIHGARLGGDEFVIAMHGVELGDIDLGKMANQLRTTISGPVEIDGGLAELRVSVGCSSTTTSETLDDLARRSDFALYGAKREGRGQARVVSETDSVSWDNTGVTGDRGPKSGPDDSSNQSFLRELIDVTERHGIELTASNRPPDQDDIAARVHVNLVLDGADAPPQTPRRFSDFPPPTGAPAVATAPAEFAQS